MSPRRIEICGVPVDCVDMQSCAAVVDAWIAEDRQTQTIFAVNPEKVIRAQNDAALLSGLREAALLIPDGIGVVLAARLLGLGPMRRVPGSELMPELCALAARRGYSIFLYGASPEVNAQAAATLVQRYPSLVVSGRQDGYIGADRTDELIGRINASGADILFVALGSPRQELWMQQHRSRLRVKVCQGVGGTLDVIAGHVKRAPRWARDLNLEWLYRLLSQPRRLLRQSALPKFAFQVFRTAVARK